MKHAALALSVIAVAAAVVGCSSSVGGSGTQVDASSSGATSTSTSTSASTSASTPATSISLAAIVVQPGDLPAGWDSTPYQDDPTDAANQAALVRCVGGKNTASDKLGESHSPDYTMGDASVSSSATRYKSAADLDADKAIIASPKIASCYETLIKAAASSAAPAGTTVDSVSVSVVTGSNGGPSNVAGSLTATSVVDVSGKKVTVYSRVAYITGPKIEAEVDFEGTGVPVSSDLFASLVKAVAARAAG